MLSNKLSGLAMVAVVLFATVAGANAVTIFDNGDPDDKQGLISTNPVANPIVPREVADDFMLDPGSNVIRDIHWFGFYFDQIQFTSTPLNPDDFTVRIFDNDGGLPGTQVGADLTPGDNVGRTSLGQVSLSEAGVDVEMFSYSIQIAPIVLAPNTIYWLSIFNASTTTNAWFWATHDFNNGNSATGLNGTDWTQPAGSASELAFSLTDDVQVAEPASLALFGIGLAGFAATRRRRMA